MSLRDRFCGDCGTPLIAGPASATGAISLGTWTHQPEGERKQITVLFADVAGSMDLQEQMDAEAWAAIMGRLVAILTEGVRKFGGTVDKFTGDGVMALFGAPTAQEDHARRACHAAWHVTQAVAAYADELRRSQAVDLHVRLGLNSGEVVIGRVGDDETTDSTALGHAVGLAERMESMAEPGQAYLTEHTARLVEGWFDIQALGPRTVKGVRIPLHVYVLGAPLSTLRRRVGTSPLMGRDPELDVLEDALALATEGEVQVIGVVGEAGIGKSRLCDELVRVATARGITVHRTSGVSHAADVPLVPILALLRDYFSITGADTGEDARHKIAARLLERDRTLEPTLPLIFDFLGVADEHRPPSRLSPELRLRRIFETLRRITQRRSEQETLVLLLEDLQWFDSQSAAFLTRLIESLPASRTLVVANFRPEFTAPWMRHSYYRQLVLAPLGDDAAGKLLDRLLGVDESLAPVLNVVLDRSRGNPFFIEELVRALVEDGTLAGGPGAYRLTRPVDHVRLPASVHAVLAARVDRLAAQYKAVLQAGAVIGRTFPEALLAKVTGLPREAMEGSLRALCTADFVEGGQLGPPRDYRFRHPLTQEVAYGSLLAGSRSRLHAAVAKSLIEHEPDRLDEQAAVLAWHWEQAGDKLEAARWAERAGVWGLRTDLGEATGRWRAAIALLGEVEEGPDSLELGVRARSRLIQFGARIGTGPEEAERLYAEGRVLAERRGDVALLSSLTAVAASARFWRGDLRGGLTRYLEAAHLADHTNDTELQAAVWFPPAAALSWTGPLIEGLEWAERALQAGGGDPDRGARYLGFGPLTWTLQIRAAVVLRMGRLAEAQQNIDGAIELARSRGESEILAWALALVPQLAWLEGETYDTVPAAAEAVRLGEETGNVGALVLGLEGLALAHLSCGRAKAAAAACERALADARRLESGLFEESALLAHLARARLAMGDADGAYAVADEAVIVSRDQGARVLECLALLIRAQVRRGTGNDTEAVLHDLDAAADLTNEIGAVAYQPLIHEQLGRLHVDEGQLRHALALYREIGARGHARRLEMDLAARTSQ